MNYKIELVSKDQQKSSIQHVNDQKDPAGIQHNASISATEP